MKIKTDTNPIRIIGVCIIVILGSLQAYLCLYQNWSFQTSANLISILCNFVGTLWICSGVYLLAEDKYHLRAVSPSKSKSLNKLGSLFNSASDVVPFGLFCLFLGNLNQAFILIGTELQWF